MNVIIQKNLKNLEDYLPFIEFAYNRSVHSTTEFSPFEIGHILFLKRGGLFNAFPNLGRKVIKSATKEEICFLISPS